jgi:hypothetical protein
VACNPGSPTEKSSPPPLPGSIYQTKLRAVFSLQPLFQSRQQVPRFSSRLFALHPCSLAKIQVSSDFHHASS